MYLYPFCFSVIGKEICYCPHVCVFVSISSFSVCVCVLLCFCCEKRLRPCGDK